MTRPEWAPFIAEWMHPGGLVLGLLMPLARGAIRSMRWSRPCFKMSYVVHDFAMGLSLPSFLALCLCTVAPSLLDAADRHTLMLAGGLGILYVMRETFGTDSKEDPYRAIL